jgi:hypothetical protein
MSRKTHLKIKIKTLADEGRYIHAEESKLRGYTDKLRKKAKKLAKSDPEQAKKLRQWADQHLSDRMDLMGHRKDIVRPAARTNLLAYGFLRGRSYAQMERYSEEEPNWGAIEATAKRFGGDMVEYERWETAARSHFRNATRNERAA